MTAPLLLPCSTWTRSCKCCINDSNFTEDSTIKRAFCIFNRKRSIGACDKQIVTIFQNTFIQHLTSPHFIISLIGGTIHANIFTTINSILENNSITLFLLNMILLRAFQIFHKIAMVHTLNSSGIKVEDCVGEIIFLNYINPLSETLQELTPKATLAWLQ